MFCSPDEENMYIMYLYINDENMYNLPKERYSNRLKSVLT